jgi:hypothetical protein
MLAGFVLQHIVLQKQKRAQTSRPLLLKGAANFCASELS